MSHIDNLPTYQLLINKIINKIKTRILNTQSYLIPQIVWFVVNKCIDTCDFFQLNYNIAEKLESHIYKRKQHRELWAFLDMGTSIRTATIWQPP